MKNFLKCSIILFFLFCTYIFICAFSYVNAVSDNLSDSVFRLHVLANSNSTEDQNLKYIVRANVLEYMNKICSICSTKEEVICLVEENIEKFQEIAEQTIIEQGYSYPVTIEIGNFEFPTKTYGDISFPAGYYDALRIKIGEASGENWWCVMFPPLCFINSNTGIVSEESKETLASNLPEEEFKIISDSDDSTISFKFKLIELFENVGLITANNN